MAISIGAWKHWVNSKRALRGAMAAVLLTAAGAVPANAEKPWSRRMADTAMQQWPAGRLAPADQPSRWNELGILLNGMDAVWYSTANSSYYDYVKSNVDPFVAAKGPISTYNPSANPLCELLLGRQLLLLYRVTQSRKYYEASRQLHQLLASPKRLMALNDLYAAQPFFAEYASVFHEPQDFAKITHQFTRTDLYAGDLRTRLLHTDRHGTQLRSPTPHSGPSVSIRAGAMGWYMMALVDTLPYYPKDDPGRPQLLGILRQTADAVVRRQDFQSGLWSQVMNKAGGKDNGFESSASCMFTYALARAVRLGFLPQSYIENAERGWTGIRSHFLQTDVNGKVRLAAIAQVIASGNGHHQDGAQAHSTSSPVGSDPTGVGTFLLAATEMEIAPRVQDGLGSTVLVDGWYNSQQRTNAAGQSEYFHYKWNDMSDAGFAVFGHIFSSYGVATDTLYSAPTEEKLKGARIYMIVSPDNTAKNPSPHYMNAPDAEQIAGWVNGGGVLVILENDPANADIPHMDILADKFGLHFNNVLVHHVIGRELQMGRIEVTSAAPPFNHPHMLYMKDTCSLSLSGDAKPLLIWKGYTLMAVAHYGRGTVVAVTDPWLYNEYTDGRNLPADYDNFAAGEEFVGWLLHQR